MPRILILCTGNSARSQMAEALLKSYDARLEVWSAGTEPAARVHPNAVRVMEEIGIDISDARPKSVELFLAQPFHYVITVCGQAEASCPAFHGAVRRRLHFPFDDPAAARGAEEQVLEAFRRVRDQMSVRFRDFYLANIRAATPRLRPARQGDLEAARRLLIECELGAEGLETQFPDGYAVVDSGGELAGVAGMEVYGEDGLLRSVAVAPEHRGTGQGALLVRNRLEWAAKHRLRAVYLLTTTAADFFARMGFWPVERESVPEGIRTSEEYSRVCPASATVMCLALW
ncbi:MAG: arsenic resistance N-acetyltransferase ArsN2 [Bryobacteraceae bacterium]|jgi:arsenate reductase